MLAQLLSVYYEALPQKDTIQAGLSSSLSQEEQSSKQSVWFIHLSERKARIFQQTV